MLLVTSFLGYSFTIFLHIDNLRNVTCGKSLLSLRLLSEVYWQMNNDKINHVV